MPIVSLALRSWLRYCLPLALLSVLAFLPLVRFAMSLPVPQDGAAAKQLLTLVWIIGGTAWVAQLAFVAAAAPAVRAVAGGAPISQLRLLARAFVNLARMALPVACAVAAIVVGGMALAVPGLLLVGLLALTAASTEPGLPGPLLDSVAVVRAHWRPVAIAMLAILAFDLVLVAVSYLVFAESLPKKPAPQQLASYRALVRIVTLGLVAATPIAASVLAAIRVRAR